jgi:hypothetical protein
MTPPASNGEELYASHPELVLDGMYNNGQHSEFDTHLAAFS